MIGLVWTNATTPNEGAAQAADLFRDVFGYEPRGVWSAPGHVSVTGEHVDYNGGPYAPIALSHRAYVALSPREDRTICLISPQTREVIDTLDLDVIGPKGTPGEVANHWAAYLAGVVWTLGQAEYGPLPGFDAALWSYMSLGGGLSSSAVLGCATMVVLDGVCSLDFAGAIEAPNDERCKVPVDAVRAVENQVMGASTGGLDQTASLRCREGYAPALDCRDMSTRQASFDPSVMGPGLLVIDMRAKHSLMDGQHGSRRMDYEESACILGVGRLVEAEDLGGTTAALGNERLAARTRHVISEIVRTRALTEPLDERPLDGTHLAITGALLNDSHDSLHDDYEVSCEELNMIVEATRAVGVHSVCMTDDGFGGSAIALVDAYVAEGMARTVTIAYAERGWESPHLI